MVNRNRRNDVRCNAGGTLPTSGCKDALYQLQQIDFSLVDTILYLDAYPESGEAMSYYRKLLDERARLCERMSAAGCPPVTAKDLSDRAAWEWVDGPWPWEADAN